MTSRTSQRLLRVLVRPGGYRWLGPLKYVTFANGLFQGRPIYVLPSFSNDRLDLPCIMDRQKQHPLLYKATFHFSETPPSIQDSPRHGVANCYEKTRPSNPTLYIIIVPIPSSLRYPCLLVLSTIPVNQPLGYLEAESAVVAFLYHYHHTKRNGSTALATIIMRLAFLLRDDYCFGALKIYACITAWVWWETESYTLLYFLGVVGSCHEYVGYIRWGHGGLGAICLLR